ncbi:hypothetical protein BJY00DRAFT_279334, partial [Aspergillus carlsbadensis]
MMHWASVRVETWSTSTMSCLGMIGYHSLIVLSCVITWPVSSASSQTRSHAKIKYHL